MNMLIQVMGLPFAELEENKLKEINQQHIKLILDFKDTVNVDEVFKDHKYIMIAKPEASTIEDQLGEQLTLFDIN